jgi:hypothetical protein
VGAGLPYSKGDTKTMSDTHSPLSSCTHSRSPRLTNISDGLDGIFGEMTKTLNAGEGCHAQSRTWWLSLPMGCRAPLSHLSDEYIQFPVHVHGYPAPHDQGQLLHQYDNIVVCWESAVCWKKSRMSKQQLCH